MYPLYVATSLLLLFASIFCLGVAAFADVMKGAEQLTCMLISSVGILFFLMCTMYMFFNLFSPAIGVSVNSSGIRDYTVAGKGAGFIPKEAIVSLRLFGKDNKEFLGITVLPDYIESLGLNKAAKREIKNNIESGTPAIIIKQSDINVSIYKLMKLMINRFEPTAAQKSADSDPMISKKKSSAETMAVLQQLDGFISPEITNKDEQNEDSEVFTLDFEDEAPPTGAKTDDNDSPFTILTVDDTPSRPKTIDEMLATLVQDRRVDFPPITIDDNDDTDK